jgi:hypothetical protein
VTSDPIEVAVVSPGQTREGGYQKYRWQAGELSGISRTPFFDAARSLLANGADPDEPIEMVWRREGPDSPERDGHEPADGMRSLKARIGVAAKLSVGEEPIPRFRRRTDADQDVVQADGDVTLVPAAPGADAAHEATATVEETP